MGSNTRAQARANSAPERISKVSRTGKAQPKRSRSPHGCANTRAQAPHDDGVISARGSVINSTISQDPLNPVLRGVNSVNNSGNTFFPTEKRALPTEAEREQEVKRLRIASVGKVIHTLLTGLPQETHRIVHGYLESPKEADRLILDAWARCGSADLTRHPSIDLTSTARASLTPLGLACLVRYARAWIDAAEASLKAGASPVG